MRVVLAHAPSRAPAQAATVDDAAPLSELDLVSTSHGLADGHLTQTATTRVGAGALTFTPTRGRRPRDARDAISVGKAAYVGVLVTAIRLWVRIPAGVSPRSRRGQSGAPHHFANVDQIVHGPACSA